MVDRGVNAIVYMVDAADSDKIEAARNELHNLLEKPQLAGIPVLVLGNEILYTYRAYLQCCGFGSGIRCLFDPWIRDPGCVEIQHLDTGSGMNNPDHIF